VRRRRGGEKRGKEQRTDRGIICHSGKDGCGQVPLKEEEPEERAKNHPELQCIEDQQGCPLKVQGL